MNRITKEEAVEWIKENFPKFQLLYWPITAAEECVFLDVERNVEFTKTFNDFKCGIKKDPSRMFNPSKAEITEKIKQTNLERYGVENTFQSEKLKLKIKQTNLERYGVEYISQTDCFKKRVKQTCLEKYGVEHFTQLKTVQDKKIKTCLEKYGVKHTLQSKEIRKRIRNTRVNKGLTKIVDGKTMPEWAEDKNLGSYVTLLNASKIGIHPSQCKSGRSLLELKMKKLLDELGASYVHDKKLPEHEGMKSGFLRPDFLLLEYNLVIECDGEYYHQDRERDERRNRIYADLGYDVLCFSGENILNNWTTVREIVLLSIK